MEEGLEFANNGINVPSKCSAIMICLFSEDLGGNLAIMVAYYELHLICV